MAGDLEAGFCRFADEQPDLVGRIAVRLAVDTNLDDLRAEEDVLPDGLDDLIRRVGIEVLGIDDAVILRHFGRWEELAAHAADDDPRVDERGARNPALID